MTASPALRSSLIRSFTTEDIPQVADLHRRVFGLADRTSPELLESYRTYFTQVFLTNPWRSESTDSVVYQEQSGRITGFLAVMPRQMVFNGETIQAKITSQFVVDPDFRGLVGLKLLGAVFAGPQDITIADESNADSRKLWEGLGGITSHLYSMRWVYPLRPCQFGLQVTRKMRLLPAWISAVAGPAARTSDGLISGLLKFPCRPATARVYGDDLDCETLSECLADAGRRQSVRPDYDHHTLSWILQRASQMDRNGRLRKVLVKTERQEIAGWYLYYANPGGISEVVQLYAKPHFAHDVLDHLVRHAWGQGGVGLSGRIEPSMMQAFADKHCFIHCGPQWTLLHSRRPELLHAFNGGTAGFSRLDGEWCLHFR